jgi:hypothetical protein
VLTVQNLKTVADRFQQLNLETGFAMKVSIAEDNRNLKDVSENYR